MKTIEDMSLEELHKAKCECLGLLDDYVHA